MTGPLTDSIRALAQTPDDASDIDQHLTRIAQLAADRVAAVSYASVTALRHGAPTTVAASSQIATAVDEAQYAEQAGPCLNALYGTPTAVQDIDATMTWPGFRTAALAMGLRASISLPLIGGSGKPVAALNLYGHDTAAITAVTAAAYFVLDPEPTDEPRMASLDPGGRELVAGFAEAVAVRDIVAQAIAIIAAQRNCGTEQAYLHLRIQAASTGACLTSTAHAVIAGNHNVAVAEP